jgi:hypothetical protein
MPQAARSAAKNEKPRAVAKDVTSYFLRLYVAGATGKSTQAIRMVKDLCALFPRGSCKFEVIDLELAAGLARKENIVAVPCLVRVQPPPRIMVVGLPKGTNRMLAKLGLPVLRNRPRKSKHART